MLKNISFYKISNFIIKLTHYNDAVFKEFDSEFKDHKVEAIKRFHGEIILRSKKNLPLIPEKAIKIYEWNNQKKFYKNKTIFIKGDKQYLLTLDFKKSKAELTYNKGNKKILFHLRYTMKWLTITIAERLNHLYLHGAAIHYKDKNILIVGNSGSGKSTIMKMLCKKGGYALTDDTILILKNNIKYFCMRSTVDAKSKNKNLINIWPAPKNLSVLNNFMPSLIILPKIINRNKSSILNLDRGVASKELFEIYKKEFLWNSFLNNEKKTKESYSTLCKNIPSFYLFAGNNIKETRNNLFSFLDKLK